MNELKRTTLMDRIKNTIKAFKGDPIGSIHYGLEIKRCDKCEYKVSDYRDNMLVIAGARAAYMDDMGDIDIPEGLVGEDEYSSYIIKIVDSYYNSEDVNFDEYIKEALISKFGKG